MGLFKKIKSAAKSIIARFAGKEQAKAPLGERVEAYRARREQVQQREQAKPRESVATRSQVSASNRLFAREIANAARNRPSTLGARGHQKVQVFYRATQNIWQGLPVEQRNKAIMDYFETDSLYRAFLLVMAKQKDVFKKEDELEDTEASAFYNEDFPVEEKDGTPITTYIF